MNTPTPNLLGFTRSELTEYAISIGQSQYRGTQLFAWLYGKGVTEFSAMTDLGKELRSRLEATARIETTRLVHQQRSHADGTTKFVLGLSDGLSIESVLIPPARSYLGKEAAGAEEQTRLTLCVSTQVGCPLDCRFCATGTMGLLRNLTAGEIVDQLLQARRLGFTGITNVVFMGMGEPLLNYDNVMKAAEIISAGVGIAARRITVSTAGWADRIRQMGDERRKMKLAVSLHSAVESTRTMLMPITRKYNIRELVSAIEYYYARTKQRVTFEHILFDGVNDTDIEVTSLIRLARRVPCKINVIPFHTIAFAAPAAVSASLRPSAKIEKTVERLRAHNLTVMVRSSAGEDIEAACGQLVIRTGIRGIGRASSRQPQSGPPTGSDSSADLPVQKRRNRSILPLCVLLFLMGLEAVHTRPAQFRERVQTYDVLHYLLDLRVDEKKKKVDGTVTLRLVPVTDLASIEVDAAEMTVRSARLQGNPPRELSFRTQGGKLTVFLPKMMNDRDTLSLAISYSCTPRAGLYFIGPDTAYPDVPVQVWSQGEMEGNRFWFPCYDYPNDKATVEMKVTVNEDFTAISNGALLDVVPHPGENTKTFHWHSARPFSSYLISLVVGEYEKIEEQYGKTPVHYYVYPHQRNDAGRSFSKTVDMLRFFSEKTGCDYPWEKYAQTVVADFIYGGMENTSAATLSDRTIHDARAGLDFGSDNLVAHELAHQWFGDLVTCRNWSHAWLNEGFATYFQALYVEHDRGLDAFQLDMLEKQNSVVTTDTGVDRRATVTDEYVEAADLFDGHIYARGASILHMLRYVIGDRLFWQGIQRYLRTHQYESVETRDFQRAMENVSGQNLDWFFEQWTLRSGFPVFVVTSKYDSDANRILLSIRQEQQVDTRTPLYQTPISVEVSTPAGRMTHRVMLEARADQTITISSEERPRNVVFDKGGWVLKKLTHQKPTEEWSYQLRHGDAGDRIGALQALAHVIDRTEIREVVAHTLAHDQFWGVRREAATALGKSSDSNASELLTRALRDPDAKVRLSVVAALKGFKTRAALAALQQVLSDDSSYAVVAEAIGSLVQLDPSHGMSYCEKGLSLDSHNDVVRAASAKAMGTLKTAEARSRLFGLTSYGQRRDIRIAALEALADNWRNDEEVRRRIEDLVDDPKHHVRRKALEKLGAIASEKSRTVLVDFCNREADAMLRREARRALASIDRVLQSKSPIH